MLRRRRRQDRAHALFPRLKSKSRLDPFVCTLPGRKAAGALDYFIMTMAFTLRKLRRRSMRVRLADHCTTLAAAWVIAAWARRALPIGGAPGADYQLWPWMMLPVILLGGAASIALAAALSESMLGKLYGPRNAFRQVAAAAAISTGLGALLLPGDAALEIAYFFAAAVALGVLMLVIPGRLRVRAFANFSILDNLEQLIRRRSLVFLWLRYRIEQRYTQTVLGIVWIILLPLATAFVLAFAFRQLSGGTASVQGVPTVTFLLSGLSIFGIFSSTILKARGSIIDVQGIISRVYFPREIIILLVSGEALVDFLFTFVVMIFIDAAFGIYPNIYYLLLPLPIIGMLILSTGLAFILSWLSLLIRDLQQLLTVVIQLLLYTTVLYASDKASSSIYRSIMQSNPLSAIVFSFRDIILYNRLPDLGNLLFALVVSLVIARVGYVYFKINEDRFVDLL